MTPLKWDAIVTTVDGERALLVLPSIPDGGSDELREGIARRRLTTTTGRCPCGARMTLPNRRQRRQAVRRKQPLTATVEHEADCPAGDSRLRSLLQEVGR